jgi:hypothetical protein
MALHNSLNKSNCCRKKLPVSLQNVSRKEKAVSLEHTAAQTYQPFYLKKGRRRSLFKGFSEK